MVFNEGVRAKSFLADADDCKKCLTICAINLTVAEYSRRLMVSGIDSLGFLYVRLKDSVFTGSG